MIHSTQRHITTEIPVMDKTASVARFLTYPNNEGRRIVEGGLRTTRAFKSSQLDLPIVSIITVCLNSSNTIEQCFQSVFDQMYGNIEYIVIDGGSTDGTLDLINKHKNAIDYFLSEPDRGLYHAMNKGLELASGDYILILNSDDWYPKECVDSLIKEKNNSGADFVSALALYVDKAGDPVHLQRHMPFDSSLRLRMPLRHETMLLSADIYNDIGLYNEKYRIIADLDLTVRLYEAGYTHHEIQRPLLYFRNDGVSITNKSALFEERVELIKAIFPFLDGDEAKIFSQLSKLIPDDLLGLICKYHDQSDFCDSLRHYFNDRERVDQQWNVDGISWPDMSKNAPLVSVILPVYNGEKTLKACIDSVLSQTLKNIELICINDVSHDNSQEVIESYLSKDARVILLVNPTNIGLGATRNTGIRYGKGSYVFHIDPDDTIPPNALEMLYITAIKYSSDMVKGAYIKEQLIHGKKVHESKRKSLCHNSKPVVNTTLSRMPQLLNTTEGHWSYLYKIDLALKVPYPTDLKMGQDSIFIVNALINAKSVSLIDEVVYTYCANSSSAMNTFTFRKFVDGLEWRRRAWHVLSDAGFGDMADRMLQSYWGDDFFRSLVASVTESQVAEFFRKFRVALGEAHIITASSTVSPLLKQLFMFVINNEDSRAIELLKEKSTKDKESQMNKILPLKKVASNRDVAHSASLSKDIKVATFSTMDFGGAGIGTQRRVTALRAHGVDARIYSLCVKSKNDYVVRLEPKPPLNNTTKPNLVWNHIRECAEVNKHNVPGFSATEFFSTTDSIVDFRRIKEVIENVDVVHLHWVVGLLDYDNFADVVKDKPIVWTLADMNAFTGGCHYSEGCNEYKNMCQKCPLLGTQSNLAHETWLIKKAFYNKLDNLHIICPSNWLAGCVRDSSLLGDKPVHVIPNPSPVEKFHITNMVVARIKLGLPLDKKLLLFGADSLINLRKGGDLLQDMVRELVARNKASNIEVVFFGNSELKIDCPVHSLGHISDEEYLSLVYSAVDAFVFPSREDNSPLTVGESLLCGTPVVSFAVGNVPELVEHKKTGYIADYLDIHSLTDGVLWAISEATSKVSIRSGSRSRLSTMKVHDPSLSAQRHINLYKNLLSETEQNVIDIYSALHRKIYVLTPCLNVVGTIDETIRSVVSQSGEFSIVYRVQDGGSTDGTLVRLKFWEQLLNGEDSPVNCASVKFDWVSEPDAGMYDAISKGFDSLGADKDSFMTWINGDDLLLPGAFGKIARIAKQQPVVEWVGSHTHNILENGIVNTSKPNPTPTVVIREGLCDGFKQHWLHLQQEGTFFKVILWDKCKNILADFKYAGDWALWVEFSKYTEYYQFNEPLGAFRVRRGQISSALRDKYDDEICTIVSVEHRDNAFRRLYLSRRSLHANVLRISADGLEVLVEKEEDYVCNAFYKKGAQYRNATGSNSDVVLEVSKKVHPVINNNTSVMTGGLIKGFELDNFDYFTYALKSHWELFKGYDVELYGEVLEKDAVDLKRYQDLLVYVYIKKNIPVGSKILEVGGGNSRLLKFLSDVYECWNVDKLDGVGNGPKHVNIKNVRLIKDYMGNFNTDIPDNYFDFVFSVSVLEHVPQDSEELFKNIVDDINRALKVDGHSLHLFDVVFKNGSVRVFNKFIPFIFKYIDTVNKFIDPNSAYKEKDIYYLSRDTYERVWYKYTKKSYEEFGKPTSFNVLWKKSGSLRLTKSGYENSVVSE